MYAAYVFPSAPAVVGMPTYTFASAVQPLCVSDCSPTFTSQPVGFAMSATLPSMPSYVVPAAAQPPPAPSFAPTVEEPAKTLPIAEVGCAAESPGSLASTEGTPSAATATNTNDMKTSKTKRRRRGRRGSARADQSAGSSIAKTPSFHVDVDSDDQPLDCGPLRSRTVSGDASTPAPSSDFGSPRELVGDADKCEDLISLLENPEDRHQFAGKVAEWLVHAVKELALCKHGCRVVQKAIGTGGGAPLEKLLAVLAPDFKELYESPNGNHVLAKFCEVMPGSSIQLIIDQVMNRGPNMENGPKVVARHRFGCRILERLIEYAPEAAIREVLQEVMDDAVALSRHAYGNFVIQHILEHGTFEQKDKVLAQLRPAMSTLAMHRTASHVVQRAIDYTEDTHKCAIITSLLNSAAGIPLVDVACNRYGAFVLEDIASLKLPSVREMSAYLKEHLDELTVSRPQRDLEHGRKIAEAFGLITATEKTASDIGAATSHQPQGEDDSLLDEHAAAAA